MSPLLTTIQLYHYGAPLDFPTRRHAIALTLILVCFRSIRFKLSNNQAKISKQSITVDTAIRIVLLTLQGCSTTHVSSLTTFCMSLFKRGQRGCHHNCYLIADLVQESRLPGFSSTIMNPAGLLKWTQ